MAVSLEEALNNTEVVYGQLVNIANEIVNEYTRESKAIIAKATDAVNSLSNDDIRNLILQLSLRSFSFSEVKEKAALKAECAETLRKEAYSKNFNEAEGGAAARDNVANLAISYEVMAQKVYELVADLFKTHLDELHRVVDALKSVLMSRMSEAKLSAGFGSDGVID